MRSFASGTAQASPKLLPGAEQTQDRLLRGACAPSAGTRAPGKRRRKASGWCSEVRGGEEGWEGRSRVET